MIFYQFTDKDLTIVRVLNRSMDIETIFTGR